jgi:ATP adenylyltransferase
LAKKGKVKPKPKSKTKPKAKAKGGSSWALKLIQDVWPQERDFVERPERYRYVRKLLPETDKCVFCEGLKGGKTPQTLVLAADSNVMVVMNKYPYNTGHLLVLPVEHQGEFTEISDTVTNSIMKWLKISTKILREEMKCQGFNMGLNLGTVAGAGIPGHLHFHIVPRWGGDTNFFPLIAETKALPESVEQTYARLKPHFAKELKSEADF